MSSIKTNNIVVQLLDKYLTKESSQLVELGKLKGEDLALLLKNCYKRYYIERADNPIEELPSYVVHELTKRFPRKEAKDAIYSCTIMVCQVCQLFLLFKGSFSDTETAQQLFNANQEYLSDEMPDFELRNTKMRKGLESCINTLDGKALWQYVCNYAPEEAAQEVVEEEVAEETKNEALLAWIMRYKGANQTPENRRQLRNILEGHKTEKGFRIPVLLYIAINDKGWLSYLKIADGSKVSYGDYFGGLKEALGLKGTVKTIYNTYNKVFNVLQKKQSDRPVRKLKGKKTPHQADPNNNIRDYYDDAITIFT